MRDERTREYFILQSMFWMCFCLVAGFAVPYLLSCGYSNTETGMILSLASISSLILQPLLADTADRSETIDASVILIGILAIMLICGIAINLLTVRSALLSVFYALILSFSNTAISFLTAFFFLMDPEGIHINFGLCRAGGSLFYALTSSLLGWMFENISRRSVPVGMLIVCAALFLYSIFLKRKRIQKSSARTIVRSKIGHSTMQFIHLYPRFCLLSLSVIFVYFSHSLINNYAYNIVVHAGGTGSDMGLLIGFMAVIELPAMIFFNRLLRYFNSSKLLLFSFIMYSVKQLMTYFANNVFLLFAAFSLQCVAFALYIPASVAYADNLIAKEDAVKGQMMFTIMQTAGMIFSSFIAGALLDRIGVSTTLLIAVFVSLSGTVLAFFTIEKTEDRSAA